MKFRNISKEYQGDYLTYYKIGYETEVGKLIMTITGRLDTTTAPELETALNESFDGVTELILDLKDLEYISSCGFCIEALADTCIR